VKARVRVATKHQESSPSEEGTNGKEEMKRMTEDKVVLITGGGSGIGRASAEAFAAAGAKVVVSGRRELEGLETIALIKQRGGQGAFVRGDVTNEKDVERMVSQTLETFGRLDAAFNNAGIEGEVGKQTHEQSVSNYRAVMDINVLGVLLAMKHQIGAMLKNGGGAIVNNASVGGLVGFPGVSVYVASKHAVIGLTRTAALEYAKQGIRVNAVSPGGIETPMLNRFTGGPGTDFFNQLSGMHPIGRLGQPEEIAQAVLWLCSDHASFVTGQSLTADGGWTAQ
jgi:NAD(P)-dependent dehydrogenase (short-subunit alcohol dehydrogenase family)